MNLPIPNHSVMFHPVTRLTPPYFPSLPGMRAAFVFAVATGECYGTLHLAFISQNDKLPEYRPSTSPSVGASCGELDFDQQLTGQRLQNN